MDAGNMVAEGAVEAAMTYLEKNNGAKVASSPIMKVEGSEAYVTVEKGSAYRLDKTNLSIPLFHSLWKT